MRVQRVHLHVWLFKADYTICVQEEGVSGTQPIGTLADKQYTCKVLNSQHFKSHCFTMAKKHKPPVTTIKHNMVPICLGWHPDESDR